jgi:hypothetical protein
MPWLAAYTHLVKRYFAIRLDDATWRLCAARCDFIPDIDSDAPGGFALNTAHLAAGIDVIAIDAADLRRYLDELEQAPYRLAANGRTFDLSDGRNGDNGRVEFRPIRHYLGRGKRRTPGLQITVGESATTALPSEHDLEAEVQAGSPHFPSVQHLLSNLGLNQNILRLSVQPSIDVLAPAPGRVTTKRSRFGRRAILVTTSNSLAHDLIGVRSTLVTRKGRGELPLEKPLRWRRESNGATLRFAVPRRCRELSLALTYHGEVLDSFDMTAVPSIAELSFPPSFAASLGEQTNGSGHASLMSEPHLTTTQRWRAKVENWPGFALVSVVALLGVTATGVWAFFTSLQSAGGALVRFFAWMIR